MPMSKEVSVSSSGPTVHLEVLDAGMIRSPDLDDFKGTNVMSPELGDAFGRYIAFLQKRRLGKAVILREQERTSRSAVIATC